MTCSANGGFNTPYLDAYVFFYICDLSFCAYQGFLVVLFEALSLSIRHYTRISIARLNQLDACLSSIHVPALSCRRRLRTPLLPALKMLRSEAMHVSGLFLHSQPPKCSGESFRVLCLN